MQLYTFFRSSTSFRLRIALAYKGLEYEAKYTSLPKSEHKTADYLRVNPQGLVPALIDDEGRTFTQSMAMIEYLDDKYPNPPLMPKSAEDKWYVRAVSQIIGCEIHPLNNVRVLKYVRHNLGASEDTVNGEWYPHWIAEGLTNLEAFLVAEKRTGIFCFGDQFTMADICLVPQIYNAQRFKCDLTPYPITMKVFAAADATEWVRVSEPMTQGDKN